MEEKKKVVPLIEELGRRGEKHLQANLQPDEKILAKLKGSYGQGFVLTDRHIFVVKWGYMTGNLFGGRCSAFDYSSVVGIEIKKNLMTGVVEVLSAATKDAHLSYWTQKENSAWKSNYAVPFGSTKFAQFQQAVVLGREQINKRHRE